MRKNADRYSFAGLPYGREAARAIVPDVLATRAHAKRSDLASLAYKEHVRRGGHDDGSDSVPPTKKALYDLKHRGIVVPLESYGYWALADGGGARERGEDRREALQREIDAEYAETRRVGEGRHQVYVHFDKADCLDARLVGEERWECYLGQTATVAEGRLAANRRGRDLCLAFVVRTDHRSDLEAAMRYVLTVAGRRVPGRQASRFVTTPRECERIYEGLRSLASAPAPAWAGRLGRDGRET